MFLKKQMNLRVILTIGMASLLAAFVFPRLVSPTATLGVDSIDAIQGLFFGLSIGCNLLWVARLSRQRRGEG